VLARGPSGFSTWDDPSSIALVENLYTRDHANAQPHT